MISGLPTNGIEITGFRKGFRDFVTLHVQGITGFREGFRNPKNYIGFRKAEIFPKLVF